MKKFTASLILLLTLSGCNDCPPVHICQRSFVWEYAECLVWNEEGICVLSRVVHSPDAWHAERAER